jgi:hypothetical protein
MVISFEKSFCWVIYKSQETVFLQFFMIICSLNIFKIGLKCPSVVSINLNLYIFLQILEKLVTALDRCASRTGSLPLETVGLLPPNCSRFSLSCLQMMFSLCR